MTSTPSVALSASVAFGVAVAPLAAAGCGGSSRDDFDGGGSGKAGSGGAATGGSSNGAVGGTSGDSSGASSGSGGADATGGAAGDANGGSSGATGGASAAAGGSGGAAGRTGTLGETCSPRGALACAGNHQKLTLLCGADGTWQPSQTCENDAFCDSTPGPNLGTCEPVAPGCEDGPGTRTCDADAKQLISCGPDAVTTTSSECAVACVNGECRDDCPPWGDYDPDGTAACATDCGVPANNRCGPSTEGCPEARTAGYPAVVRTPASTDTCACSGAGTVRITLIPPHEYVRVSLPSPWGIGLCGEAREACAVFPPATGIDLTRFQVSTDVESGPVNVLLEEFETEPACPQ